MPIKVGRVPYLEAEPFYFDMERRGFELRDTNPRQLGDALASGELDAGPAHLSDVFRLEDRFEPVSGFCFSTQNRAMSACLYSQLPMAELGGVTIGVSDEDVTAVKLVEVLLRRKYGVAPGQFAVRPGDVIRPDETFDAFLLIGNRALRRRRGVRGFAHRFDLGEEWTQWTNLPFVFSRWVVRKDLDDRTKAVLEDALYVGLEEGVDGLYHLNEPRDELLMLPRDVVEYVQGIRYYVGRSEQQAIARFREYLADLGG
ncbi:MAG: menaquinone biosynthesis protein [Chloroflexi bacterium]|nr:menaquinone biosynthesis protein [Chloroflexota bacterium]MYD48116.1 menaquinone biosynthesis protein [Chloroflexota bacterium]